MSLFLYFFWGLNRLRFSFFHFLTGGWGYLTKLRYYPLRSYPWVYTKVPDALNKQPKHKAPTISSIDKSLSRNRHRVLSPTHGRAIKEENKVANRWVDHKACSLLQYSNVIAKLFFMRNYFNGLRWKIIRANILLQPFKLVFLLHSGLLELVPYGGPCNVPWSLCPTFLSFYKKKYCLVSTTFHFSKVPHICPSESEKLAWWKQRQQSVT